MKLDPRKPDNPIVWSYHDEQIGNAGSAGIWSTPAVHDDLVVTTTNYGQVIGLDRATGAVRWKFHLPGPVWQSPVIVDDTLLQGDCLGVLRAYDVSNTTVQPPVKWELKHRRLHRVDADGLAGPHLRRHPGGRLLCHWRRLTLVHGLTAVASLRRGAGWVARPGRVGFGRMTTFDLIVRNGSVVDGTGCADGAGRHRSARRSGVGDR